MSKPGIATTLLMIAVLIAFAGNSLLNRAALADGEIDWASFTIIRLVSGAFLLIVLLAGRHGKAVLPRWKNRTGAISLFIYAAAFSFAYVNLEAGIGAIILFPAAQITMQAIGFLKGTKPSRLQLSGSIIALAGLVYLMLPGTSAPPLLSALLMASAGIAWGFYSWAGKGSPNPELLTGINFVGAGLISLLLLPFADAMSASWQGIVLAIASGMITSALGYILWYKVLTRISITAAAVSQLSVLSLIHI